MTIGKWQTLQDLDATRRFAHKVVGHLPDGAVVILTGPLGAGKTTFVRAFVHAAGGPEGVSSPTYTLMHEYPTARGPVVHVDAYRLEDAADAHSLGLDDAIDRAHFTLIEWGDRIASALPPAWRLELARPASHDGEPGTVRHAKLTAPGETA